MEIKETILQVLIAALSVIGFYGILHGLFESFLVPRQITSAVVILKAVTPEELDILLCEAHRAPFRRQRQGVVLVVSARLLEGCLGVDGVLREEYAEVAEKYGVRICLTDTDGNI